MSLQKNRTKVQKNKETNILPAINYRTIKQQEPKKEWTSTAEIYQKYMRAKLENVLVEQKKQIINNIQKPKMVASPIIIQQVQKNDQSPIQTKALQKEALTESRHVKSTPKLSLGNLQKKKSLRENRDRYLHNQKIAIQLNLPKRLDISVDSQEQSLHRELLRDQGHRHAQPTVFVLKKNSQHNLIKSSVPEQNVLITERPLSSSRLQIVDNSKNYPFVPNLPNKQSLFAGPKESKYIKQKFVGQEAINKFYDRYKKIDKIREMQKFKLQLNPITMILTILQNYNIPPKKMEVIKLKGEEAILDLKNCALGGGVSLKAVSQIVQKVTVFQQIDLSYNQLTSDICDMIIPNLAKMRRINLSYNKIGRRGVDLLSTLFYNQEVQDDCELQQLNLQSNNLSDTCFGVFFTNLQNMNYLLVLNLSKNYLGNFAAIRIKEFLINDNQLYELYLHWCEMGTKATKLIFQGLSKNNSVKVLDLSWNQIGFDGTKSFCTMVKANTSLIHLDISFCQIDEADSRVIAKALKHNQTIYGLHYQGNMGFVDFKGFLHFIKKQQRETPISIRAGLIQRINSTNIIKSLHHNHTYSQVRSVCWICEGWDEKYFRIAKSQGDKGCFIHLDFENYTGVRMTDKGTYFQILRMCPPTKLQLFFTKINENGSINHMQNPSQTGEVKIAPFNRQIGQFLIEQKRIGPITLKYLNTINQPLYYNQIFNEDYLTKIHCQPRTDDMRAQNLFPVILPQSKQVQKTRKHKPKKKKGPELAKQIEVKSIPDEFDNIFNKNKGIGDGQTYENFIKKCVQFDFSHSKVTKIIKQQKQLKEIKNILQKNYEVFQKIYYYLANNNPNNNGIYSISENRFEKFIQEQGYQTKRVIKAKIRLKLISCLSNVVKDSEIIGFYRPQFFQFLLRLAMEKWCVAIPKKEGETEEQKAKREKYPLSISQAFQRMIKSLKKYEQKAQASKWRQQNLASYEISIVVKSYSSCLEQIYQKYAGLTQKNMNTKQKKKMLLQQMKILFMNAQIRKTKQALKDLQIGYRTAKKLEIQDGISDTGLDYVQFLQAFCRFAEGLFLAPIGSETNSLWQKQVIKSQQIPLFLKIEKLLKQVFNKNYDIKNKKMELLFETGLFPQQVGVLMHHYKQKYQNKDNFKKIFITTNIKMNGLQFNKNQKITLKYLISILEVKAAQIRQKNKLKLLEVAEENKSSDEEQDQNK